ncbi:hypothetical protein ACFLZA_02670 [Candidatus Neomarinimicrobiota bacterium]
MKSIKLILIALLGLMILVSCGDTKNDDNANDVDAWIGTWLSAGTDVAPILANFFFNDSIIVEFKDDKTLTLDTHTAGAAWTNQTATYVITESADGDIHHFAANYTAFEQEGIIEIIDNVLRLEAVQTVPDIGAVPATVAGGFGADPVWGAQLIQTYRKVD